MSRNDRAGWALAVLLLVAVVAFVLGGMMRSCSHPAPVTISEAHHGSQ